MRTSFPAAIYIINCLRYRVLAHIFWRIFKRGKKEQADNMVYVSLLKSGTKVKNVDGSDISLPRGYTTWKQFYTDHASWPASLRCRIYGCSTKARAVAHIKISESNWIYVIPMCAKHNYCSNLMSVNGSAEAVEVDEENPVMPKIKMLKSGTEVRNASGTADDEPAGFDSWKEFYENKVRRWPSTCRILGCGDIATDGAHVYIPNQTRQWIIPMCSGHNHPRNTDRMSVNQGTFAVLEEER